jgi:phytoene desaturase
MKRVAVIGGGMGGLTAATRLADKGFHVTLYEANDRLGGKIGEIEQAGARFPLGPTVFTMRDAFEEFFDYVGAAFEEYVTTIPLDPVARYFYPDGTTLDAKRDPEAFERELVEKLGEKPGALGDYFDYARAIHETGAPLFLWSDFSTLRAFRKPGSIATALNLNKLDPFRTMHQANDFFFDDERTARLFDRYATYNGSSPYRAPATLNLIAYVENVLGAYHVRGGVLAIVNAIERLAERVGVEIKRGVPVERIVVRNRRVAGVVVNGAFETYDAVVSNADVERTYGELLEGGRRRRRLFTTAPSTSGLLFLWNVERAHKNLAAHNVFFSEDYRLEFRQLFKECRLPDDPTVYVHIPAKMEPETAPAGTENWYVLVNAPASEDPYDAETIDRARSSILARVKANSGIDVADAIVAETTRTPRDLERETGATLGSIYGPSSNGRRASFLRQRNKARGVEGLYFAGGGSHPGGGVPLAALSGKHAADLLFRHNYERFPSL